MPPKKPALGRGLSALFNGGTTAAVAVVETPAPGEQLRRVPIDEITPNPYQPRKDFDPEKLADLTASIKEKGILQPLILRKGEENYQIVAGERRWRAAREAGLKEVPAIVREFTDQDMTEAAIIENIQRDDLNAIEESKAYETLMNRFGVTQEAIARAVGKSRVSVTNSLRLLKLPAEVIDMVRQNRISAGHARALLSLDKGGAQVRYAREILEKGLSVRQIENEVREIISKAKAPKPKPVPKPPTDSQIADIQEKIALLLGMKVRISASSNTTGKVEVFYATLDDFQKLCDHFGLAPGESA